jgi:hypothetical protein
MVSTVPAHLQNIIVGTATRRNDQEWTNFKQQGETLFQAKSYVKLISKYSSV